MRRFSHIQRPWTDQGVPACIAISPQGMQPLDCKVYRHPALLASQMAALVVCVNLVGTTAASGIAAKLSALAVEHQRFQEVL